MTIPAAVGSVSSLFKHVENGWWKTVFDEFYIRTDGDVVDDPKITEEECNEILSLPHVGQLFSQKRDSSEPARVLDLCCGQAATASGLLRDTQTCSFTAETAAII